MLTSTATWLHSVQKGQLEAASSGTANKINQVMLLTWLIRVGDRAILTIEKPLAASLEELSPPTASKPI